MVIVDASVAVTAWLHDGAARHRMAVERLAAPHLIDAEATNSHRPQAQTTPPRI